jgi:hypothetical protein
MYLHNYDQCTEHKSKKTPKHSTHTITDISHRNHTRPRETYSFPPLSTCLWIGTAPLALDCSVRSMHLIIGCAEPETGAACGSKPSASPLSCLASLSSPSVAATLDPAFLLEGGMVPHSSSHCPPAHLPGCLERNISVVIGFVGLVVGGVSRVQFIRLSAPLAGCLGQRVVLENGSLDATTGGAFKIGSASVSFSSWISPPSVAATLDPAFTPIGKIWPHSCALGPFSPGPLYAFGRICL